MVLLEVKVAGFEGPLDLLACLVRENRLDPVELPLAEVARQYLAYLLGSAGEVGLEELGDWLILLANLLSLKLARILPQPPALPGPGEMELVGETPAELKTRMLRHQREYAVFKQAALCLTDLQAGRALRFSRPQDQLAVKTILAGINPLEGVSIVQLAEAWRKLELKKLASREQSGLEKHWPVRLAVIRVEEEIARLEVLLAKEASANGLKLEHLVAAASRQALISTFVALLELMRLERILVRQEQPFGEILVFWRGNSS